MKNNSPRRIISLALGEEGVVVRRSSSFVVAGSWNTSGGRFRANLRGLKALTACSSLAGEASGGEGRCLSK